MFRQALKLTRSPSLNPSFSSKTPAPGWRLSATSASLKKQCREAATISPRKSSGPQRAHERKPLRAPRLWLRLRAPDSDTLGRWPRSDRTATDPETGYRTHAYRDSLWSVR